MVLLNVLFYEAVLISMSASVDLGHLICFIFFEKKKNYALAFSIKEIMSLANETNIELFNFHSVEYFSKYVNRNFL